MKKALKAKIRGLNKSQFKRLKQLTGHAKTFFKAHQDFQKRPDKYKGKPKPPQFKRQSQDNLIYTYQGFQVKDGFVVLEKDLKIKLPKQLQGQTIKQIEIIPKAHSFYAVFVYEEPPNAGPQVSPNDQVMAIDLGLNNLATCITNGIVQPFIIDGRRLKSINAS